jgi:putative photosynthetic complex assembly protein
METGMTERTTSRPFPRGPLFGAAALVMLALLLAGVSRFTGVGTTTVATANPIEIRDLRFEDRADGSVAVLDAKNGKTVEILAPGTNGFVRGVMRGLARDRRLRGLGDEAPFELTRWDDDRLSLTDTATGHEIELVSFGVTQLEVFAKMLHAGEDSRYVANASHVEEKNP